MKGIAPLLLDRRNLVTQQEPLMIIQLWWMVANAHKKMAMSWYHQQNLRNHQTAMSQQPFGRLLKIGVQSRQTDCSATTGWCFQVWQRLPSIRTPLSAIFMGHHIFQIHWRYLIRPLDSTQRGNTTNGKSGKRSSSISPSSDTVVDSPHLLNSQPSPTVAAMGPRGNFQRPLQKWLTSRPKRWDPSWRCGSINGGLNGEISYKWRFWHGNVWLQEGHPGV